MHIVYRSISQMTSDNLCVLSLLLTPISARQHRHQFFLATGPDQSRKSRVFAVHEVARGICRIKDGCINLLSLDHFILTESLELTEFNLEERTRGRAVNRKRPLLTATSDEESTHQRAMLKDHHFVAIRAIDLVSSFSNAEKVCDRIGVRNSQIHDRRQAMSDDKHRRSFERVPNSISDLLVHAITTKNISTSSESRSPSCLFSPATGTTHSNEIELVASSKTITALGFNNALAIHNSCLSPTEKLEPPDSTGVSKLRKRLLEALVSEGADEDVADVEDGRSWT